MKRHIIPFLLGFLWILSPVRLRAQNPLPEAPTRHVLDISATLPASTVDALDARLVELERKSGTQVVAYIAPSLPPGEDLEEYVRRVFNEWKIGEATRNNGVLFAVFVNDHRMRIEVGSGLSHALPNQLAARILRDQVAPRFRINDFAGGVNAGVNSIVQVVRGEYHAPTQARIHGNSRHGLGLALQIWMVAAGVAGAFAGIFMRGLKTRNQPTGMQIGHTIAGGLVGGFGHPLAVYLGSEFHVLAGLAVAAALWMWFFSSPGTFSAPTPGWDYSGGGLGRSGWGSSDSSWWGNGWGSRWGGGLNGININLWGDNSSNSSSSSGSSSGGFFGDSGSSSSSSSDSGFSGGGGSSDGGGASGSW